MTVRLAVVTELFSFRGSVFFFLFFLIIVALHKTIVIEFRKKFCKINLVSCCKLFRLFPSFFFYLFSIPAPTRLPPLSGSSHFYHLHAKILPKNILREVSQFLLKTKNFEFIRVTEKKKKNMNFRLLPVLPKSNSTAFSKSFRNIDFFLYH